MTAQPRFTIFVPMTRPDLAHNALASIKEQSFTDFEVVVSDNSQNEKSSELEEYLDDRFQFLIHQKRLDVIANWNSLIETSKGQWLLFVCDDDVLVEDALSIIDREIRKNPTSEIFSYRFVSYYPDGLHVAERLRRQIIRPRVFSFKSTLISPNIVARQMMNSGTGFHGIKDTVPYVPLAAVNTNLIKKCLKKGDGNLFRGWCPMISGAVSTISTTDSDFVIIDSPLVVLGNPPQSAGAINLDDTTYKTMHKPKPITHAKLSDTLNFANVTAETFLQTKEIFPKKFGSIEFNWGRYFLACGLEIFSEERHRDHRHQKVLELDIQARRMLSVFQFYKFRFQLFKNWLKLEFKFRFTFGTVDQENNVIAVADDMDQAKVIMSQLVKKHAIASLNH